MLTLVISFCSNKKGSIYIVFIFHPTDRECPLFNKARDAFDEAVAGVDPSQKLMNDMKETGLAMTRSAISTLEQMSVPMQVCLLTVFTCKNDLRTSTVFRECQASPKRNLPKRTLHF